MISQLFHHSPPFIPVISDCTSLSVAQRIVPVLKNFLCALAGWFPLKTANLFISCISIHGPIYDSRFTYRFIYIESKKSCFASRAARESGQPISIFPLKVAESLRVVVENLKNMMQNPD